MWRISQVCSSNTTINNHFLNQIFQILEMHQFENLPLFSKQNKGMHAFTREIFCNLVSCQKYSQQGPALSNKLTSGMFYQKRHFIKIWFMSISLVKLWEDGKLENPILLFSLKFHIVGSFNYKSQPHIWSNILESALERERINVLISLQYNETCEPERQSLIDQSFLGAWSEVDHNQPPLISRPHPAVLDFPIIFYYAHVVNYEKALPNLLYYY